MKMNRTTISFKTLRLSIAVALLTALQSMAATVILSNGKRIDGTTIRANRSGDIILTTTAGQQTFPKGTYTKAIADKPAEFDQARSLAGQGKHEEAIALLEKIANDYRFLDWDNHSYMAIASIHSSQGKHDEAVAAYDRVIRLSPELKDDAQFQAGYRGALLAAGKFEQLEPMLQSAITSGSRADAARAQVMRGDIRLAQGQIETAVMDYLRTAILFESEADVQPEALFKAGTGLEQLRDPRAKDMYRKVVDNYPSSEYAKDARSKLL